MPCARSRLRHHPRAPRVATYELLNPLSVLPLSPPPFASTTRFPQNSLENRAPPPRHHGRRRQQHCRRGRITAVVKPPGAGGLAPRRFPNLPVMAAGAIAHPPLAGCLPTSTTTPRASRSLLTRHATDALLKLKQQESSAVRRLVPNARLLLHRRRHRRRHCRRHPTKQEGPRRRLSRRRRDVVHEARTSASDPIESATTASYGVLAAILGTAAIVAVALVALRIKRRDSTKNFGPTASTRPSSAAKVEPHPSPAANAVECSSSTATAGDPPSTTTAAAAVAGKQFGRSSKKSDVWCLGLLILEILAGRPATYEVPKAGSAEPASDLVAAVGSTPEAEWVDTVVDPDLRCEEDEDREEMVKLIRIGMACCESNVDSRWELKTAIDMMRSSRRRSAATRSSHSTRR
ncbi:hypothetical protein HU200_065723 [Digitaria exilis]|uniref:Protein kinase domain-containing protein n=1 Tax=Digitaria exilis TaxID=1010633 RepID=A0A835DUC2_9POAL|nr:hypothetical protein HU200_065723 [Digitaria exilis]